MKKTNVFQRGESVPCRLKVYDNEGDLFAPSQGCAITVYEPDGTIAKNGLVDIDGVAMTSTDTGKYVYFYTSATDDPTKKWNYFCKAIDGEGADAITGIVWGGFRLT